MVLPALTETAFILRNIKVMPTDKSISTVYNSMNLQQKLADSIPAWGDAIIWDEFHNSGFSSVMTGIDHHHVRHSPFHLK